MEVHQSLPAQYLHNPYLVKADSLQHHQSQHHIPQQSVVVAVATQQSTSSGSESRSSPSVPSSQAPAPVPASASAPASAPTAAAVAASSNQQATYTVVVANGNINDISNRILRRQQPGSGPDYRLYGYDITTTATTMASNAHSSPNVHHNGRPLTADRKRPYNCNLCSSRFGSKMELEEHQNSHTGQKPFECNMCKARFNRRSTLWNHKRIHSDDKPFECNVCRMTFKWKNSLKCHKEMHQRKNEMTGIENDPLEKTLTYATAAKRRHLENHNAVRPSSSSEAGIIDSEHSVATGVTGHLVGSGRRRNTKSSIHARPTSNTDIIITTNSIPNSNSNSSNNNSSSSNNNNNGNNNSGSNNNNNNNSTNNNTNDNSNINTNHSLITSSDVFIQTPLHADGLFSSQKTLSISDHKELDSLLSSATRITSMLKDDSAFKTNLCDDLTVLGNQNNTFDVKQEMNLFHTNPFMMFGAHQLQNSVQTFTPSNLAFSSNNGGCGEYFHLHLNNQTEHVSQNQQPQQQSLSAEYSTDGTPSQATEMLINHGHNVIAYQTQLEVASSPMIAPSLDYTVTGNNLEYMLNNYSSTISSATAIALTDNGTSPGHLQQQQQQQQQPQQQQYTGQNTGTDNTNLGTNGGVATAGTSKEVPQVSW